MGPHVRHCQGAGALHQWLLMPLLQRAVQSSASVGLPLASLAATPSPHPLAVSLAVAAAPTRDFTCHAIHAARNPLVAIVLEKLGVTCNRQHPPAVPPPCLQVSHAGYPHQSKDKNTSCICGG
jgi:hypothetical protein